MRIFLLNLFQKFQRFSQKLDNTSLLTNQRWVLLDDRDNSKIIYIFRANHELIISKNGLVEKGKWDCLDANTIVIDTPEQSYLYKNGFFDDAVLALKVDSNEDFAVLLNETKYSGELNSLSDIGNFLENKYSGKIEGENYNEITGGYKTLKESFESSNETRVNKFRIGKIKKYLIEFTDGRQDYFYHNKSADQWYFKKYSFSVLKQVYSDKQACIQALYHFLKTGEMHQGGFIKESS